MKESHMIWARVSFDREQLVPLAPDGYEPVIEVFLHGRADPIVPAYVETRNDGWVRVQVANDKPGEGEEGKWHHADSLLHAHVSSVARVEIRFRKVRPSGPVGFSYGAADESRLAEMIAEDPAARDVLRVVSYKVETDDFA